MSANPRASVAELREAAIRITMAALGEDGDAASALACELFDSVMDAEGVRVPSATVYDGPRSEAVEATVRRVVGDVDGTPERAAEFVERIGQLAEREVTLAASRTTEQAVERAAGTKAGRRVRFARVPTRSVPCPWCAMLASRGFVYRSAESAEAGSHHHCTCTIVPGVQGSTRVAGYDTGHYMDVWLNRERYENEAGHALSSFVVDRSLGAKALNEHTVHIPGFEDSRFFPGSTVEVKKVFAGRGSEPYTELRVSDRLADTYGGEPEGWSHVSGEGYVFDTSDNGRIRKAEVHWMESADEEVGAHEFWWKRWVDTD